MASKPINLKTEPSRNNVVVVLLWFIPITLLIFLIWMTYLAWQEGTNPTDLADIPLIKAESGAFKIRPDDPGGMQIEHSNKEIFDMIAGDEAEIDTVTFRESPTSPVSRDDLEQRNNVSAVLTSSNDKLTGKVYIQLGSYTSKASATEGWRKLNSKFSKRLKDKKYRIIKKKLSKGTYYRLQAGTYKTKSLATKECSYFNKNKQPCLVVR